MPEALKTVKVRFAPSPTGLLHVGNARTALVNWLYARQQGGSLLLRLDDTDAARSSAAFADAIREDLAWCGLDWDEEAAQSARLARYKAVAEALKAAGRLYPCYETPEELETRRKLQMARRQPPVYDCAALRLTEAERAKLEAEGRKPHWRFRLDETSVAWEDMVRGPVTFDLASLSDPILVREDGTFLYTLPSVVDDVDFGITHIVRGEDHVSNTAVHVQIFEALGAPPPAFGHMALLAGAGGEGLSKRLGSLSLRELRSHGIEPMALMSLLARIGTADPVELRTDMDGLVAGFDIGRFGRATPRFDTEELAHLNSRLIHELPFEAVRERLGILEAGADFWEAVRGNLARLDEARDWWLIINEPLQPLVTQADRAVTETAAAVLQEQSATAEDWPAIVDAVKARTGAKGKALFHPLRLALTGRETGPELKHLLPLIGKDRAIRRLKGDMA